MKVQKLGIEWGPAYQEAEPIRISSNGKEFVVFVAEGGDLILDLPSSATVSVTPYGLRVTIPDLF